MSGDALQAHSLPTGVSSQWEQLWIHRHSRPMSIHTNITEPIVFHSIIFFVYFLSLLKTDSYTMPKLFFFFQQVKFNVKDAVRACSFLNLPLICP